MSFYVKEDDRRRLKRAEVRYEILVAIDPDIAKQYRAEFEAGWVEYVEIAEVRKIIENGLDE